MTDDEVFKLLFPDKGPVIDGVQYWAGFWDNRSIWCLAPLDSDGQAHGTVRRWDKGGSFNRDMAWVHGKPAP